MSKDVSKTHRPREHVCSICGKIVEYPEITGIVNNEPACWECSTWANLASHPKKHFQVINGQYFIFPPVINSSERVRHILTVQGELVSSTELFNYGTIPGHLKSLFPTTAHFVNYHLYRKIKANERYRCRRLGCWDRMQCFWFKEEKKDWNVIPADHKIGAEECPMFINILNPND